VTPPTERVGVLVINFGEPHHPVAEVIEPFLERIFLQNAGLEPTESARERARQLATDRAPGLIDEYLAIGGSPLNAQADAQAAALHEMLRSGGWDVRTYSAFQFTAPFVEDKVREAADDGVDVLVALPIYPMCGQSTTVAALASVRATMDALGWRGRFVGVAGWHHHPAYVTFRADHVRAFAASAAIDPNDADTLLYFSAHGTPLKYLDEGNRYDRYVEEHTREIAHYVGARHHVVGFQNHANRRIRWTLPDNEALIRQVKESRLIVVPISFMHEQSETLAELDRGLASFAEGLGKEFHRVPVPHDDPRFVRFLADLVGLLVQGPRSGPIGACRCAPWEEVLCTNGNRDLPPSPYASPVVM
jgi:ferrochelatase